MANMTPGVVHTGRLIFAAAYPLQPLTENKEAHVSSVGLLHSAEPIAVSDQSSFSRALAKPESASGRDENVWRTALASNDTSSIQRLLLFNPLVSILI